MDRARGARSTVKKFDVASRLPAALSGSVHVDALIAEVARGQHSLITRGQLRSIGLSDEQIRRRVESGQLERLEPRLFRVGGAIETWQQRVLGACMSVGPQAAACRRTAAALWGLGQFDDPPIEKAVPRPRSPQWVSAQVFRSTDLIAAHRMVLDGIPVTNVPRTLVDLGAVAPDWIVENAVDSAVVRRLVTVRELRAMLDNVARQGRRGVGPLRRVLENLQEGPESVLEMKLLRLILSSTLPRPRVQYWVDIDGSPRFRLDVAYPEALLAIEADGRETHSRLDVFSADRERQAALEDLGWRFLRFTWHHVTRREEWVISRIREVYGSRLRPCS